MNDDETTQSLSEKVLDRSNVLQFPAPTEFSTALPMTVASSTEAQGFAEWRRWVRSPQGLNGTEKTLVDETTTKLAEIMRDFGRPFGHRLAQAIRAYVANYPAESGAGPDARVPLADQVEFRLLPRLRGVEIDAHDASFERLEALLRGDLDDSGFADRVNELRQRQRAGTGLFVWRGLERP
jgi:hypothetical protein